MKKFATTLAAVVLGFSGAVIAAPATPPAAVQQQVTNVSEADLAKFVDIYINVETTRGELAAEMSAAGDPAEAQKVQARMRDEIIGVIEAEGWSLDKYNQVAQAITANPELRERAMELINQ